MKTEYHNLPNSKKEYDKINWPIEPMAIANLLRTNINAITGVGWTVHKGKLKKLVIDFNPEVL